MIQEKPGPLAEVETFSWRETGEDRVFLADRVKYVHRVKPVA